MSAVQELLFPTAIQPVFEAEAADATFLETELSAFVDFGKETARETLLVDGFGNVPVFINEFWTAKQRAASSLHEVSYRACFKPQLPRFFIERLTRPGDIVYDPFMGRGTTLIEAALLGRTSFGCDINPLSQIFVRARLNPPNISEINSRLREINFNTSDESPEKLLTFYHPETLREICALKKYFLEKKKETDWTILITGFGWLPQTG